MVSALNRLPAPPGPREVALRHPGRGVRVGEEEMADSLPERPSEPHVRSLSVPQRAVRVAFDVKLPAAFMKWLQRSLNRDEEPTKKFFEEVLVR